MSGMKPATPLQQRRMAVLLAYMTAAADAGAPCPNNAEAMAHIDAPNLADVNPLLDRLENDGLIRTERTGNRRRVQIVATGAWTDWTRYTGGRHRVLVGHADPDDFTPKYREGFRGDLPAERYVVRDACGYCGVRGDIGCRHSRRAA